MSKVYVAFTTNGSRVASGSATTIRKKVQVYPDTQWAVYLYDLKNNVETLIVLLEGDLSKLPPPTPIEHWRITSSGQVRKVDPTKVLET